MATVETAMERSQSIDRSPRIPAKRFPLVHTFRGIDYEVHKVTRENLWELRQRVLPFERAFGYANSFLIHQKVIRFIKEGSEVEFARTRARDIGVVTQEVKKVVVGGQNIKVLSIGIRVVFPEYQKHGIGTHLAEDGVIRHQPDAVTGQTRVWRIFNMYQETGLIKNIAPIDRPITSDMQEVLRRVLDRGVVVETDLRTGLCLGIYPPGAGERFIPPNTNLRGVANYDRIRKIGADPAKGDGIRYYAIVDQEAVLKRVLSRDLEQERVSDTRVGSLKRLLGRMIAKLPFRR